MCFFLDFFFQVGVHVRLQINKRRITEVDAWQPTEGEHFVEIELGDFLGDQRVQMSGTGAPCKQVHTFSFEGPGTAAREQEGNLLSFYQKVYFIEQCRNFLNFINNNPFLLGIEQFAQKGRTAES